jgi:glycosyltransferase involved in cell wall biosynthesis
MLHPPAGAAKIFTPNRATISGDAGATPVTGMVSVIIPVHTPVRYLAEALDSALAQTWNDREIIVVNDGSPETPHIERLIGERSASIVYLEQPNRGPGAARNAGIAAASGDFFAFLDADDYWAPAFLAEQMALLAAEPQCGLAYCDARIVRGSAISSRTFMEANPSSGPVSFMSLLAHRCTVLTSTVVARASVIRAAGGFDETLWRGQDFDLWLRLAQRGTPMCYRRTPLAYHRVHGESLSGDFTMRHRRVLDVLDLPRWQGLPAAHQAAIDARRGEHLAGLALTLAKQHLAAGRFEESARELRNALAIDDSWKLRLVLLMLRAAPRLLRALARRRTLEPAGDQPHAVGVGARRG